MKDDILGGIILLLIIVIIIFCFAMIKPVLDHDKIALCKYTSCEYIPYSNCENDYIYLPNGSIAFFTQTYYNGTMQNCTTKQLKKCGEN